MMPAGGDERRVGVRECYKEKDWALRDKARLGSELEAVLQEELVHRFIERVPKEKYEAIVEKVMQRNLSPYEAIQTLLNGNTNLEK